jgi:hypothetical protein
VHLKQSQASLLHALPENSFAGVSGRWQMTNLNLEVNYSSRSALSADLSRTGNVTVRLTGRLIVHDEGEYEFFTLSNNGSQLTIDGTHIANDNEVHSEQIHSGKASLSVGHHNISLEFAELRDSDAGMMFSFRGPNFESQSIVLPSFTSWREDVSNSSSSFGAPMCPSELRLRTQSRDGDYLPAPASTPASLSAAICTVLVLVALSLQSTVAGCVEKRRCHGQAIPCGTDALQMLPECSQMQTSEDVEAMPESLEDDWIIIESEGLQSM